MSGLFRRLSSRRSDGPGGAEPPAQAEPGAADAPADAPAQPGGHRSLLVDPAAQTRVLRDDDQPTTYQRTGGEGAAGPAGEPAAASGPTAGQGGAPRGAEAGPQDPPGTDPARTLHPVVRLPSPAAEPPAPYGMAPPAGPMLPVSDLPAGVDPDELAAAPPTSARRSRLRRRVSFLRAAREVLLRDLGGFVYELHRTAGDIEHEAHRRLREVKLSRLTRLDAELHELELRLDDVRRHVVVREPGVGGECPHCGELFGSDAHYCSHCGLPLTESARKAIAHEAAPPAAAAEPPHDQPTEEYSPLHGDPEFAWPQRPASAGAQEAGPGSAASGDEAPTRVTPSGETPDGSPEAAGGEAPASADAPPAADEAPTRVIGAGGTPAEAAGSEAPAAPAEAAGGETQAAGTEAAGGATPAGGTDTAGGETQAAGTDTAPGEAPASDDAPVGAEPADRRDAAASGEDEGEVARSEPAASAEGEAREAGGNARDDAAAGRNGSAFSPVERRR